MKVAVAKRPVEAFDTKVTLPEWQLEPDSEAYYGEPDNSVFDIPGAAEPKDTTIIDEIIEEPVEVKRGGDAPRPPNDLIPQAARPNP